MEPTNNCSARRRTTYPGHRRGSLYIAALGVTMIVSLMSLAAMHVARMNIKAASGTGELYEAAVLASSAVENALIVLENTPAWRTSLQSGVAYPSTPVVMGGGTFTWKLIDEDGSLADDTADAVWLQGIGRIGGKTYVEEVRLVPTGTGLTCLEASLHCHGDLNSWVGAHVTTNQKISSNGNIWFTGSGRVFGSAQAVGYISAQVSGTKTTPITPRKMPGASAFDYYISMGTMINFSGLSSGQLTNILLSPQSNPYGSPNPQGVYVIDCKGGKIDVKNLRVLGTLVILNPGPFSSITGQVLFEPAIANFPSLLVKGDIAFAYDSYNVLDEMGIVNFNPVGSPYKGVQDTDPNDVYPCIINGLVYISGKFILSADFAPSDVDGVLVCGSIEDSSDLRLTYRSTFLDYPPPGFAAGSTMSISPGSWKRAISP